MTPSTTSTAKTALIATTALHSGLPAMIATITSVNALQFVGKMFRGDDELPAIKIPQNHKEIESAFITKGTQLGVTKDDWFKNDLLALQQQADLAKQQQNGAGTATADQTVAAQATGHVGSDQPRRDQQ